MTHAAPSSGGFSTFSSGGVGDLESSGRGASEGALPEDKNSWDIDLALTQEDVVNEENTNKYNTIPEVNLQFMIK